jgi:hypothetical protein
MKRRLLLVCTCICMSTSPAQQPWQLVWSDEFNGLANTPPDSVKQLPAESR